MNKTKETITFGLWKLTTILLGVLLIIMAGVYIYKQNHKSYSYDLLQVTDYQFTDTLKTLSDNNCEIISQRRAYDSDRYIAINELTVKCPG